MIQESTDPSFYEVLDVRKNATPELIREAYVRAKNAFANDSLATYSLFDRDQARQMLDEIETAYNVLADPDKRRLYDQAHGFMRSTGESAPRQSSRFENGIEVSEIGRDISPLESLFFKEEKRAQSFQTPIQAPEAKKPDFTPPPAARQVYDSQPFASRFAESNASTTNQEPLSKTFVPSTSLNPNAHFIHKRFQPDPQMEEILKLAESVDGAFLRKAREYKVVSVDEVMEFTKLSRRYVEALENDDLNRLPAPVYVRGFVVQYAKSLQLDANKIAASYMRNFQSLRESRGIR